MCGWTCFKPKILIKCFLFSLNKKSRAQQTKRNYRKHHLLYFFEKCIELHVSSARLIFIIWFFVHFLRKSEFYFVCQFCAMGLNNSTKVILSWKLFCLWILACSCETWKVRYLKHVKFCFCLPFFRSLKAQRLNFILRICWDCAGMHFLYSDRFYRLFERA